MTPFTARMSRALTLPTSVNDINPVNWKTVLVGYMQVCFLCITMTVWAVFVLKHPDKGMQEAFIGIIAGLLAGLSGITLAGRGIDRTTDYGYVERKNAGKAIDAAGNSVAAPQQVNMGDGSTVNVAPLQRTSTAIPVVATPSRTYDPGA